MLNLISVAALSYMVATMCLSIPGKFVWSHVLMFGCTDVWSVSLRFSLTTESVSAGDVTLQVWEGVMVPGTFQTASPVCFCSIPPLLRCILPLSSNLQLYVVVY